MPKATIALVTMLMMWIGVTTSQAVVIAGGNGSGNTTAPTDDPGFANVGNCLGSSCVYLGNGWVLTAAHIDYNYGTNTPILPSSVQFGGTSYSTASGSLHQLTNNGTTGMTTLTDMVMFQLTSPPSLPTLTLTPGLATVGQSITMIGNGLNRDPGTAYWDASWTQLPSSSGAVYSGFKGNFGSNTVRWGTNTVGFAGQNVNDGLADVYSFISSPFDSSAGYNEAQALIGDSGGAVFVKNGTTWQLAGMMYAAGGPYPGQPGNVVVNGDVTAIADLSFYSSQIDTITGVPEPSAAFLIAASALPLLASRRKR